MKNQRTLNLPHPTDPTIAAQSHDDTLLTVQDVAAKLAISVRQVWRLVSSGDLPRPIALGGSTRWSKRVIEDCIEAKVAEATRH